VLNYSRGQQFDLLRELGFNAPSWQDLASTLILLLCAAALAGAAWAWWDRRRQDPWQRLQQRVALRLLPLGVRVQPHHPPRERAAQLRRQLGPAGEPLAQKLDELDRQRYGATAGPGSLTRWWRTFQDLAQAASKSH
jgi:hypothetical protein